MTAADPIRASDTWLARTGPEEHVVVSSRARYARNLPGIPFPMRARPEELAAVAERVAAAVSVHQRFRDGYHLELPGLTPGERTYLKENLLISPEMEKGNEHRAIFLSPDIALAVMINEEDHLRLYALDAGFRLNEVLNAVIALESDLAKSLGFAFSPKFGYLTACPTNTGTGLRASVMVHLPGMVASKQMAEFAKSMPQLGLTVRGFYGENSEHIGDFFQISNEITLGKSEEEIVQAVCHVVERVIEREEQARRSIFEQSHGAAEDEVWRAYGILTHARSMSSDEAVRLLSRLRYGVDRGFFPALSHGELNRLIIAVQPGHLQYGRGAIGPAERDALRAELLRARLASRPSNN